MDLWLTVYHTSGYSAGTYADTQVLIYSRSAKLRLGRSLTDDEREGMVHWFTNVRQHEWDRQQMQAGQLLMDLLTQI